MTTRISGYEAIEYVEAMLEEFDFAPDGAPTLRMYGNPIEPEGRDDLTPDEAREIAAEDPALIYYDRKP